MWVARLIKADDKVKTIPYELQLGLVKFITELNKSQKYLLTYYTDRNPLINEDQSHI